jgi:hypothetical protein
LAVKKYCEDKNAWGEAHAVWEIMEIENTSVYPKLLELIINSIQDPLGYKDDVELVRRFRRLWHEYDKEYKMRDKLIITKTGKQIFVRKESEKIMVFGDTFPIKEELKKRGFKWDPSYKVWYAKNVDLDKLMNELETL